MFGTFGEITLESYATVPLKLRYVPRIHAHMFTVYTINTVQLN
jgi:hypothetical protein